MNTTAKNKIVEAIELANMFDGRGDVATRDRAISQVYDIVDAPIPEIDAALVAGGYGYAVPARLKQISISVDGVWAGSGVLRDGTIENCGAQFCDDLDKSAIVYEKIESAIAKGKDSINIRINGLDDVWHEVAWSLT